MAIPSPPPSANCAEFRRDSTGTVHGCGSTFLRTCSGMFQLSSIMRCPSCAEKRRGYTGAVLGQGCCRACRCAMTCAGGPDSAQLFEGTAATKRQWPRSSSFTAVACLLLVSWLRCFRFVFPLIGGRPKILASWSKRLWPRSSSTTRTWLVLVRCSSRCAPKRLASWSVRNRCSVFPRTVQFFDGFLSFVHRHGRDELRWGFFVALHTAARPGGGHVHRDMAPIIRCIY